MVIGVGSEAAAATVAAEAMERDLHRVADIHALLGWLRVVPAATVLIAPGDHCRVTDMQAVATVATHLRRPIGFLATWLGERVVERQLQKVAAYRPTGSDKDLLYSMYGFPPLATRVGGRLELASGSEPGAWQRMLQRHRLVAFSNPGSPAHSEVSHGMYACAAGDVEGQRTATRLSLPCHHGSRCMRCVADGERMVEPERVSPADVVADCVIWGTCSSIALTGQAVDPMRSVAATFLRSRWIRDMLGTFRVIDGDPLHVIFGVGLAQSGLRMGDVCLQLNQASLHGSHRDVQWLLLGDPAGRLPGAMPTPLRRVAGERLSLPADQVAVWRCGRDAALLACDIENEPRAAEARQTPRLLARPVPGTGLALAIADAPLTVRPRPLTPGELPPEQFQAVSILRSPGLSPALKQLLQLHRGGLDPKGQAATGELLDELASMRIQSLSYLTEETILFRLSGPSHHVAGRREGERRRWTEFHSRALSSLLPLLQRRRGVLASLHSPAMPLDDAWQARADRCPHCGTELEESAYRVEGWHVERTRVSCLSCGSISDAPTTLGLLRLEVGPHLDVGKRAQWLVASSRPSSDWSYWVGAIVVEEVSWPVLRDAGQASAWQPPSSMPCRLEGMIELRPDVPPGVYALVAAMIVQGEPCFARKQVAIEAAREPDHATATS